MNLNSFDLNLLKAFDALMRDGNMTVAGSNLGLTQPAMSRALQRLRVIYNDPLFVRTARGMRPTEYALELAQPVQIALAALRNAIELNDNFSPPTSTRTFRIVMTDVAAAFYLPPLIPQLKKIAPHVCIESMQVPRDSYMEALEVGTAELALGQLPKTRNMHRQKLRDSTFVCVMRKNHPTIRRSLSMQQFLDADHVAIIAPARADEIIRRALGKQASRRNIALSVPYYLVVPPILTKSDLIAVLPETITTFAKEWGLKTLPLPFKVSSIPMGQFWHERSHHDVGHRWLRNTIAEMVGAGN